MAEETGYVNRGPGTEAVGVVSGEIVEVATGMPKSGGVLFHFPRCGPAMGSNCRLGNLVRVDFRLHQPSKLTKASRNCTMPSRKLSMLILLVIHL